MFFLLFLQKIKISIWTQIWCQQVKRDELVAESVTVGESSRYGLRMGSESSKDPGEPGDRGSRSHRNPAQGPRYHHTQRPPHLTNSCDHQLKCSHEQPWLQCSIVEIIPEFSPAGPHTCVSSLALLCPPPVFCSAPVQREPIKALVIHTSSTRRRVTGRNAGSKKLGKVPPFFPHFLWQYELTLD